jgi:hypothetical protein
VGRYRRKPPPPPPPPLLNGEDWCLPPPLSISLQIFGRRPCLTPPRSPLSRSPPPQLVGAPSPHHIHHRPECRCRQAYSVSSRAPIAAKWTPRGRLLLVLTARRWQRRGGRAAAMAAAHRASAVEPREEASPGQGLACRIGLWPLAQ